MSAPADLLLPEDSGVLLIHLLDRCNLECRHCYLDAAPSRSRLLPSSLVLRCLAEAPRLGIRTVYLTGGEPFLHPELAEILSRGARPDELHLTVCSNGTRIGAAEAAGLRASGASVQVSIDGPEEYHDAFRGSAGAFRRTARGIDELVAAGVPTTVVITLCQDNLGCLPWLAEWSFGKGVERISVQPLQHVGRGAGMAGEGLSEEQMCDLFLRLSDLGTAWRSRGLRFSLHYRSRAYLRLHPCAAFVCCGLQCHRGVSKEIKKLVVREDGTVLPEIPTLHPRFALGNIYEATLPELVTRYFAGGYAELSRFCRAVYADVLPGYPSPIVPWDEILSERSWLAPPPADTQAAGPTVF